MTRNVLVFAVVAVAIVGCAGDGSSEPPTEPTVRILLAGDVSLGRGVGEVVGVDPNSVFADVRFVVRDADLALANLESPLTTRPHTVANPNDLRADPAAARLLADAGFDLLGIANNHAGDGGPETVLDTIAALEAAGLSSVGGGADADHAATPVHIDVAGIRIGILALDATGHGPSPTPDAPGVAGYGGWVEGAVRALRSEVDVVIVGVHGGAEYLFTPDATMRRIAGELTAWGADVVWGHGAHVVQDVVVDGTSGAVIATSLGNLLFDQDLPGTDVGAVLEVMANRSGVVAYRQGTTGIDAGRASFRSWLLPTGNAALVDGGWWNILGEVPTPTSETAIDSFRHGDLVAAGSGDLDGDGVSELVASFRRPYAPAPLHDLFPDAQWRDGSGRSAHIGVYTGEDLQPRWVASAVLRPVADLMVCDGTIAVAYSTLDDPAVVATGAWTWNGFGWDEAPDLDGAGSVGCVDVDGDGSSDPVVIRGASQD